MAEIEITLPTVQYGNVRVRATPEELGLASLADAYDVGIASAVYLNVFTQGFKKGATLDVADRGEPDPRDAVGDPVAAAQRHIESELGATKVDEYDSATEAREAAQARTADAPWDKPAPEVKKPWEQGESKPSAVDALGDGW